MQILLFLVTSILLIWICLIQMIAPHNICYKKTTSIRIYGPESYYLFLHSVMLKESWEHHLRKCLNEHCLYFFVINFIIHNLVMNVCYNIKPHTKLQESLTDTFSNTKSYTWVRRGFRFSVIYAVLLQTKREKFYMTSKASLTQNVSAYIDDHLHYFFNHYTCSKSVCCVYTCNFFFNEITLWTITQIERHF